MEKAGAAEIEDLMTDAQHLTHGSLCTGYDGIGAGLRLAGLTLDDVFFAEKEASVAKTLDPGVPNVGDITEYIWRDSDYVDMLTSGDPCQSISVAGRQQGRKDPRFLWPWVREAYRAIEPRVIFFENVANMVSHDRGRTMAERFEHLREDGYDVRWTVLGACAAGAPHHRHRWYALATRVGRGEAGPAVRMGGSKAICGAPRTGGRILLPTPAARDGMTRGSASPEHAARRRDDPKRSLNLEDAVSLLPTPRATDGSNGGPNQRNSRGGYDALPGAVAHLLPTPTTSNVHGNQVNNRGELLLPGIALRPEVWGKYAPAVALWEQITGVPAPEPTEPGPRGGRRLAAALPEWMMGLTPGHLTSRMGRNEALRAAGNGVVPLAVAAAWRLLTA